MAEASIHIHCRSETIDSTPAFSDHFFEGRRGIVAVRTFNEGLDVVRKTKNRQGVEVEKTETEQHVIDPHDDAPLGFAVLWDRFVVPGRELMACVQITAPANKLISAITDRLPAFLHADDWAKWLGEEPATASELKAMLKTVEGVRWTMAKEEKPVKPGKEKRQPPKSADPEPTLL